MRTKRLTPYCLMLFALLPVAARASNGDAIMIMYLSFYVVPFIFLVAAFFGKKLFPALSGLAYWIIALIVLLLWVGFYIFAAVAIVDANPRNSMFSVKGAWVVVYGLALLPLVTTVAARVMHRRTKHKPAS